MHSHVSYINYISVENKQIGMKIFLTLTTKRYCPDHYSNSVQRTVSIVFKPKLPRVAPIPYNQSSISNLATSRRRQEWNKLHRCPLNRFTRLCN